MSPPSHSPPPTAPDASAPASGNGESELRDRILEVAITLFADSGYGRTSMRQVAEAAGCTKPALYYHFGSKDDLFRAAVASCMTGLLPLLAQVGTLQGTVRDRIVALARGMFEVISQNPAPVRLMLSMQSRPDHSQPDIDFAAYHHRNQVLLREIFQAGVQSGEIRPDVDLDDVITVLMGGLHARAFHYLKGLPIPSDTPDRLVDLLFCGIGTGTPPSPSTSR